MTERLYLNNSYLYEFAASVVGINRTDRGFEIVLDKTAFYPETGGQLYDHGFLDGHRVIAAHENEQDEILHLVEKWEAPLGNSVRGSIDPSRRADNRRKHTGQHILSRAFIEVARAETVSSRLGEIESTIELSVGALDEVAIAKAETIANDVILDDMPVSIKYYDRDKLGALPVRKIPEREGKFRIVQVGDFDYTACGGTHCHSTGEVGLVKIVAQEKLRGHLRVTFLAGKQAVTDYSEKHNVVTRLSGKLTCHFQDLPAAVDKLTDQNQSLRREINQYALQVLTASVEQSLKTAPEYRGVKIYSGVYDNYDVKVP